MIPERTPQQRLRDMRDHAIEAITILKGATHFELLKDRKTFLAISQSLLIVGEAAHHVPVAVRTYFPQLMWGRIIGLRHRLAHDYWSIDVVLLHGIVQNHLPHLIAALSNLPQEIQNP